MSMVGTPAGLPVPFAADFFRATVNTPYGWYTFDFETMKERPVDTAPGSWDTINLRGSEARDSLAAGRAYYNNIYVPHLPTHIEPWPEFDPWVEVVRTYNDLTVPGPWNDGDKYFELPPPRRWSVSEYMRNHLRIKGLRGTGRRRRRSPQADPCLARDWV